MSKLIYLLKITRFLPLFITQFLGAFNDNVFKNALVILITYVTSEKSGMNAQIMVTVAAGIFILPFFLFSATAGQLADKYEKSQLIRKIKLVEIILMCGAAVGFYLGNVYLLIVILFMMGTQSTFFGPLKYSILPEHLYENELVAGNAIIETGTFLSILLGTIIGSLLIMADGGIGIISAMVIGFALFGYIASWFIPKAKAVDAGLKVNWNIAYETWNILSYATKNRDVFLSILGISWFWLIGAMFLSQFPTFAKMIIGGNEQVVTLFLTLFSVGIGAGSLFCNKLLKGEVKASYVPLGALGITLFTIDLYFASQNITAYSYLIGVKEFFYTVNNWRIAFDLLMISVCAGIYIVPLYAIMQSRSEKSHRARIIASNNVLNALFMVLSAVVTVWMLASGFIVTEVFLTIAVLNSLVAVYICKLLPDVVVRGIVRTILRFLYRVEVKGLENYKKAGDKVLIVANHTAMLDPILIAAFLPEKLVFAINTHQAARWFVKPFLMLVKTFPLDPANPMATKALIEEARANNKIVIFPEGRLTVTGSLMKIYEGTGMVVDKSNAVVLPIRIEGAQYTPFSRLKGKVQISLFPKITLTILESRKFNINEDIKGRKRRHIAGETLYDIMSDMIFASSNYRRSLFKALLDAKAIHGGKHLVIDDINRKPLSYKQLILRSSILGKKISKPTKKGQYVGVLLPNMSATIVTFFALQAIGRVSAMLNFSTGTKNVISACKIACINIVYTSSRFIETAKLEDMIIKLEKENIKIVYLEDIRKLVSFIDKLVGFLTSKIPTLFFPKLDSNEAAVVLFTSGSEGMPKGVVLSHKNIMANISQLSARVDFGPKDIVFNALPVFHSFGLTGGALLPILSGIKSFFYPSPLHYRIVPELVYDTNATIMFGTDTFLSGYARFAHPYDFYSVRYIFAGAEKLKEETRKVYSEKFGVRIFEGYGATETAPVLSTNTAMYNKPGTVGRLMPMIDYRLEEVPGVDDGGKLLVKGPNIMLGYLLADSPGVVVAPENGWYDTGDIVEIDEEGYITIKGRAKRFAKIGGEMVSLTAVEMYISNLWPDKHHVIISIPDAKKGEQLVLVTNYAKAERTEIARYFKANGISELNIPKQIKIVDKVPLLATGKTDYVKVKELVQAI